LENRISRTLVDTLIDIQVDEAPLIIKKGIQGERCASCSQQIPVPNSMSNPNTVNVPFQGEAGGVKLVQSSSVHNFNYKKNQKDIKTPYAETIEENIISSKLSKKSNASQMNFHLPDISKSSVFKKTTKKSYEEQLNSSGKNTPNINQKSVNFNNTQNNFSAVLDENPEKQLNNMMSSELEKKIVNPDGIMRATKRMYDNIDKKNK
jgi:hypothetical protein